jgi:hypothetical protein
MQDDHAESDALRSFTRPRYFHGQLLDVRHFESEQNYGKRKQWMLNRLVNGFGVVCGLDVQVGDDDHSVVVLPGLALDKGGREIVVPCRSKKIPIAPRPTQEGTNGEDHCDDDWVHLVICYRECNTDPEPVLAGGCEDTARCSPGAIREGYELYLEPGKAPDVPLDPVIPGLIKGNIVNYRALVDWVSAPCDCQSGSSCITLANIHLPAGDKTVEPSDIDISVRPIVYGLDLLWELVLSLSHETPNRRTGKY